jgi:predicted metalloendopeptidase
LDVVPAAFLYTLEFFSMHMVPSHLRSALTGCCLLGLALAARAQSPATPAAPPQTHYEPAPAFDTAAINKSVDPCTDFYQYACGNYAKLHPIPSDQTAVDQFYQLFNVDTQELNGILTKFAAPSPTRTPSEQKIGDDYAACMNTALIDQKGLAPVQPLLTEIDKVSRAGLPYLTGELQRIGVNVFFGFGEQQDFKDATKQVASFDQGGLGLPERDYYTRTGDKDKLIRQQYVEYITKMLVFAGEPPQQALADARNILAFETKLAEASQTNTERRNPEAIYHPETIAAFEASIKPVSLKPFLEAIHAPASLPGPLGPDSIIDANPKFFPAMVAAVMAADMQTLRAYLRFHLLATFGSSLPTPIDQENFHFYGTQLEGQPEQRPRWKRCSNTVDGQLGEVLGRVYVEQYFPGEDKPKTLQMVHDIEAAMDRDIDTLDWMSPATRVKAKEKLHAVANKIGYPDHWRDYSKLAISPTDAFGNALRATAFENDRELDKIGKPVDKLEWGMTPPTVNAYYNPSMNDINFPAGILQPAFYDPKADLAVNYGHIGAIIGHELTHGFDDEGRKFDGLGNLSDWWTPEDGKKFEAKAACLVHEYGSFTAVPGDKPTDDVKVNGQLTLGENTADNGGLVLAYLAYLDRARKDGLDTAKKLEGYTGPQRFYIAFAQNYCENSRPEAIRQQVLTDPHSPDHFRANGAIVNQPGFAAAFSCKKGSPMVPADSCRVW